MKKLIIIFILIFCIFFISGCVEEDKIDSKSSNSIDQEKIDVSEIPSENQNDYPTSSEKIFNTEWYKIGETQQFDVGNENIIEVESGTVFYTGIISKNSQTDNVKCLILFKDEQDNILLDGQPYEVGLKYVDYKPGIAPPDNANYWQIEIHVIPIVDIKPTPTKTPIKLN